MSDGKARHHFFSRKSFTGSLHSLASRHTISRKSSTAPSEPSPLPSPALPDDADSDDGFLDARESPEASTPASLAMPDDLAEPPQQRKATTIPFTKDLTAEDVATSEAELKKDLVDIRAALEFFLNRRVHSPYACAIAHAAGSAGWWTPRNSASRAHPRNYTTVRCPQPPLKTQC
jgi:hypothetical protein